MQPERPLPEVGIERGNRRGRSRLALRAKTRFIVVVSCVASVSEAQTASPFASVAGGGDAAGHTYEWTIKNLGPSPIVEVRIPHYRASLCLAPPEWTTNASTFVVNVGVANRPGECIARASSPLAGIVSGKSEVFRLQVASPGAARGVGTVHVRFADGTETEIENVEVPRPEPTGDRYVSLMGLGAIFGVLILLQSIRRSRQRSANT